MEKMSKNSPIGVFDSGVGGLSVLAEILKVLPNENYLYFGDTLRVPYGDKCIEELLSCTRRILDFFKTQNVKAVLVACNTCSANTLELVKDEYPFEIIGLIKPTANFVKSLKVKKIGLIATAATVRSNAYPLSMKEFGIDVLQEACPRLVKFVENGETTSNDVQAVLSEYLEALLKEKIEKLILGCTHYPFLVPAMMGLGLSEDFFINPALCIAQETKKYFEANNLLSEATQGSTEFFVSGTPEEFQKNAKLFFGKIDLPKIVLD